MKLPPSLPALRATALAIFLFHGRPTALHAAAPEPPSVNLWESLSPSPVKAASDGMVVIAGKAAAPDGAPVRVRITTSAGTAFGTSTPVQAQRFACRFPQDFPGAPPLAPLVLYIDATTAAEFGGEARLRHQAEALIVVRGEGVRDMPDLPQVFTDDFIDSNGRKDADAAPFTRHRVLVNLFMQSRAAGLMALHRPGFDLARKEDFAWFTDYASLYDFDHRDRDWTQPSGHRVARGFWQAVWNRWFNSSNNHPRDGNPEHRDPRNYRPYTFANDAADLVVLYQLQRGTQPVVPDNRQALRQEVLENLLAMQHRGAENFALREASGEQQHYTAGAFRYGMFETGEWLTEGKGWFANPRFRDFERGGVLNGRCLWALGESLKADPQGPLAAEIREAIPLTLRFCLQDGLAHGYTRLTRRGLPLWGIPGEHGYLTLGMLAAAEAVPGLPVPAGPGQAARTLQEVTRAALDALLDSTKSDGTWSRYANVDAVNITALAEGSRVFPGDAAAASWKAAACRAADVWLGLAPLPAERTAPTPLFGHRKETGLTYFLGEEKTAHASLYMNGLWLHTLACLHRVAREPRYLARAHALAAYYCGANPLHVRLLSEIGSVNNRISDRDGDGVEDHLVWDAYPESTAFFQIGLLHLMRP